ncbi:Dihydrodipicolinate synthetase-like protein [Thermothelomyces thermophilus ATCC 42464]|uniref:Dihydrodipicolinate synthetase-like protein n=1 Tax=Thermothelomyces thermophilus (strain ATCC 42464 / BCRC 31852 / DSM 1799) TaxID=573729 RepID=G2QIZ3_THET4|nr:Dihydrodipicolinate synthetase-like protein [Thermothelomyces thermophilus ATCC 42464]AEO60412.1 Dihydrodipicolinate synthetase-like protein [Thermothelomyces thermophilus ATCC 42464]
MSENAPRVPPKGVFVPSPTFFKPISEGQNSVQPPVDTETQVKHSIFLARSGVTGIAILGSTGETVHLTREERRDLVSAVRKGLDGAGFPDYPLMAGVLTNGGLDETVEWLSDYAEAGAQWGLVLCPGYFGAAVSQQNIVDWYTAVAGYSPIPILIYNYPGVTNNVQVLPETYRTLAKHPKIVGCKMSHGNVSHHVQVSLDPEIDHDKFRVYSGFGNLLGPIVAFGAAGVIDGMAAYYPKTVVRLMQLMLQAEPNPETRAEIRRLQFAVGRAEEFVMRYGIMGIREATSRVAGFGNLEGGRLPLRGSLPEGVWEQAKGLFLQEIEAFESSL